MFLLLFLLAAISPLRAEAQYNSVPSLTGITFCAEGSISTCMTPKSVLNQNVVSSVIAQSAGAAQTANNLSDLASAGTARVNLGLGSIATQSAGAVAISGGTIGGADVSAADVTSSGSSTASTLAARHAHIPNAIDDFGAAGNGSTDDTTALQKAFTASATQVVTLPCGTYKITAPLTVPKNGVLKGSTNYAWYYGYTDSGQSTGVPCTLIKPATSSNWTGATGVISLGGWTHIEDIGVDEGNLNSIPVFYTNMPFDELVHIFTNGGTNSVYVANNSSPYQQGTRIRNSMLSGAHGDCVSMTGSGADYDITGNDINGCSGYALNLQGAAGIIGHNIFQDVGQAGMRLAGPSAGNTIIGNRFDGNYQGGMYISGLTGNNTVVGNIFRNDGTAAGPVVGAHIIWANNTHTGCLTFAGNEYINIGTATDYVAIVQAGAVVPPCQAIYEQWPAQYLAVYGPTAAAAISTITWSSGVATVTTEAAHGMGSSGQVQVTISGASPSGYNGTFWATMTGASTFTYPLAGNPGTETTPGNYVAQFTQAVLQPALLPTPNNLPGPYTNDATAAAGVPVGAVYEDGSGIIRKRVS